MGRYFVLAAAVLMAAAPAWAGTFDEDSSFYIWHDDNMCMVVPTSLIAADPDKESKIVGKGYATEDEAKAAMANEADCKPK
jgi:hypothetical protein